MLQQQQEKQVEATFAHKCSTNSEEIMAKETKEITYLFRTPRNLTALMHQDRITLDLLWKDRYSPNFLAHMNSLATHLQSIRYCGRILPEQPKREALEPLTLKAYVAKEFKVKELEELSVKNQQIMQLESEIQQLVTDKRLLSEAWDKEVCSGPTLDKKCLL